MVEQFHKVFIANRGEIACRAIRTLREMGIRSVVGYSDVDRLSLAVQMADEAVALGRARASDSYLAIDKIVARAVETGCDALFPGYGFLAENADMARAVEDAGMVWIGPPAEVISRMGDKAQARRTLAAAGLPVTPGIEDVDTPEQVAEFGDLVGYPLLIKPVAGGGGKGMFRLDDPGQIAGRLAASRSVAAKAFGNPAVYVEKLILRPRHVEFQFLCDRHGNGIHLGERECSVQRNHQKLIEEAPSTRLTPEMRSDLGARVASVMTAVGYVTAGTMEFLMDAEGALYAMEVNTRIQVEHTVTEMVVGMDIVRQMIRVAEGHPLEQAQDDITFDRHAIQCRINAEDPAAGFQPSFGRITHLQQPGGPFVRVDTGVYQGWEVPSTYDSLLTKLCTVGVDRDEAIRRMRRALAELRIRGVKTTARMHARVMRHPRFVDGSYDTSFMEIHGDEVTAGDAVEDMDDVLRVAALVAEATALGGNPYCR